MAQEDLNSFLSISEELKVKGLTQGKNDKSEPSSKAMEPPAPAPQRQPANTKRGARTQFQSQDEEDDISEINMMSVVTIMTAAMSLLDMIWKMVARTIMVLMLRWILDSR